MALAGAAFLGFLLPSLVQDNLSSSRRERISREFPMSWTLWSSRWRPAWAWTRPSSAWPRKCVSTPPS
ncbi:hypothetical protein DFAR_1830016 [Desulfarculales bacterium]